MPVCLFIYPLLSFLFNTLKRVRRYTCVKTNTVEVRLYEPIGEEISLYNQVVDMVGIHHFSLPSMIFRSVNRNIHIRGFHETYALEYVIILQICIDCDTWKCVT